MAGDGRSRSARSLLTGVDDEGGWASEVTKDGGLQLSKYGGRTWSPEMMFLGDAWI